VILPHCFRGGAGEATIPASAPIGAALRLNQDGLERELGARHGVGYRAVLRGRLGLLLERLSSIAGTFASLSNSVPVMAKLRPATAASLGRR